MSVSPAWITLLGIVRVPPRSKLPVAVIFPPSATENTSVDPSYKLKISAVPLCVIATPTILLLFAPTSILSTPIKFVSKVVVVPSTVKSLDTLRL
mgnify:CR=1 FL=1